MFEYLPFIEEAEFPNFAALEIRNMPSSYPDWRDMIRDRRIESIQRGTNPEVIIVRAREYAAFCQSRTAGRSLATLMHFVEEKAEAVV